MLDKWSPPENPTRGSGRKISWSAQGGEWFVKIRVASKFDIWEVGGVESGQKNVGSGCFVRVIKFNMMCRVRSRQKSRKFSVYRLIGFGVSVNRVNHELWFG